MVEWDMNIPFSSSYVVCAKEQTWRPFCSSLRRLAQRLCFTQNTPKYSNSSRAAVKSRTDSSSFSIPVGICGTALLMEAYSCRSGRSSQRKTGSGLLASSARARNDNLLIFIAKDAAQIYWICSESLQICFEFSWMKLWRPLCFKRSVESVLWSVAARAEPGRPRVSVALCRSILSLSSAVPPPVQYAMANMADITNSCSSAALNEGPNPHNHTNSHSHAAPHACAFLRASGERRIEEEVLRARWDGLKEVKLREGRRWN